MNDDAQAQLDAADMMLNDPDPEVRRQYLAAYGADLPRKRPPMPKVLYECATDNDGYPTCQGDKTSCGFGGVCAEIDPPAPAPAPAVADPGDFLMGADQPDEEEENDPPYVLAKYDGQCSACFEWHICEGVTMIRADGMDGWEAQGCAW